MNTITDIKNYNKTDCTTNAHFVSLSIWLGRKEKRMNQIIFVIPIAFCFVSVINATTNLLYQKPILNIKGLLAWQLIQAIVMLLALAYLTTTGKLVLAP
jgi:hypothetical protein